MACLGQRQLVQRRLLQRLTGRRADTTIDNAGAISICKSVARGGIIHALEVYLGCPMGLAGDIDMFDVFKRLILKIFHCVVPACQPNTANMLPTWQLLVGFSSRHMSCCVPLIADMLVSMVSYRHVNFYVGGKTPRQQPDIDTENGNNKMIICSGGKTTTRR